MSWNGFFGFLSGIGLLSVMNNHDAANTDQYIAYIVGIIFVISSMIWFLFSYIKQKKKD